ncbi:murein transglycosylase A [Alkalinema pantanalense]|uniref:murein transglycosylase A n=1 Tax=Alkalinema pantanalense TaxID=1620705 RepID=UPI003D6FC03C
MTIHLSMNPLGVLAQTAPAPLSKTPQPLITPQILSTGLPSPSPSPTVSPPSTIVAPLQRINDVPAEVGLDSLLAEKPLMNHVPGLVRAIDHSLRYLQSDASAADYLRLRIPGVTRDRVRRSLKRFRTLLLKAETPQQLQASVRQEFEFYTATGKDGQGTVDFTGYFEPVYAASYKPTPEFRYPIYRQPGNFARWPKPHPTRADLEGKDGLQGNKGLLKGSELVWLKDRLDAFLIQVQGSAQLRFEDGSKMTIGYAGNTQYPYVGIGRELVKDGKLKLEELSLPKVVGYFQQHPAELDEYLPRNQRFVFFRNTQGSPAIGSLGVPVTAERSIATDKKLMPPGALAIIQTQVPNAKLEQESVGRFVLDQDTGGAIIGPGRVDIFMGTGDLARDRAGLIHSTGKLYYLLLKDDRKGR